MQEQQHKQHKCFFMCEMHASPEPLGMALCMTTPPEPLQQYEPVAGCYNIYEFIIFGRFTYTLILLLG